MTSDGYIDNFHDGYDFYGPFYDGYYPSTMDCDGYFAIGKTIFPIATNSPNPPLQDLDTALYYLLDFCAGVLEIHAGGRFTQEINYLKSIGLAHTIPTDIVGTRVGYNPMPWLQEAGYQFPILAIYRAGGYKMEELSREAFIRIEGNLEVLYVLPAIGASEAERLIPFLNAVMDILTYKNEHGYDSKYQGGINIGKLAGYDKVAIKAADFINIPVEGGTQLTMPGILLKLYMAERNNPVEYNLMSATSLAAKLIKQTDGKVDHIFVETDSNHNPQNFKG